MQNLKWQLIPYADAGAFLTRLRGQGRVARPLIQRHALAFLLIVGGIVVSSRR
jgi:hypothetical protein